MAKILIVDDHPLYREGVITALARCLPGSEVLGAASVGDGLAVLDADSTVELVLDGAEENLDALTRRYTRHPRFYGFVYPIEQRARETRVICRIHARRVTLDAIHA